MSDFSTYDRNGVRFHYPTNWLLEETPLTDGTGAVQLSSPNGAFWILDIHPAGTDPGAVAEEALAAMRGEYADLECEPLERVVCGRTLRGYEMNFFYLDLSSTAIMLGFADERATYGIFWQSVDRMVLGAEEDAVPVERVFEAITETMLREL